MFLQSFVASCLPDCLHSGVDVMAAPLLDGTLWSLELLFWRG